jgi:hypothetical protein
MRAALTSEAAASRLIAETEQFAGVLLRIRRLRRFNDMATAEIARRIRRLRSERALFERATWRGPL